MEFQIRGISENWLILKKEERGVQFQGSTKVEQFRKYEI